MIRYRYYQLQSVLFVIALGVMYLFCQHAGAELRYYVGGKQVRASTYQARQCMAESVSLMKANHTSAAIIKLQRAIILDPSLADAHSFLGVALARVGKTDEAIEQFRMALSADAQLVNARWNLAMLYQASGRLKEALSIYEALLTERPDAKTDEAVRDRVNLLTRELAKEKDALKNSAEDNGTYFSNVTVQGKKRWSDHAMPLRVYLVPGDLLDTFKPEYDTILKQCFAEWQTASHGKIRFIFVKDRAAADIVCNWIDDPQLLESSAEGGEADVRTLSDGVVKATILLSLKDEGAFPLTGNLIRTLALHEIGHALGLLGHSSDPDDVLFCTAPIIDVEKHLTSRDVNTLTALYSRELDPFSEVLVRLDHDTHGNAVSAIRTVIVGLTVIFCIGIVVVLIIRSVRPRKRRSK